MSGRRSTLASSLRFALRFPFNEWVELEACGVGRYSMFLKISIPTITARPQGWYFSKPMAVYTKVCAVVYVRVFLFFLIADHSKTSSLSRKLSRIQCFSQVQQGFM